MKISDSGVIALYVPYQTTGGRFQCNLSAVKKDCACGTKNIGRKMTPFIVGGTEVQVNEFPMFSALVDLDVGKIFCGGTISKTPNELKKEFFGYKFWSSFTVFYSNGCSLLDQ